MLVIYTFCGAFQLQSVKLQTSLGSDSVQDSTYLQFNFQTVCDCTFTVLKSHDKNMGHVYDINLWEEKDFQITLGLTALPLTNYITSNFNSLIFLETSHRL